MVTTPDEKLEVVIVSRKSLKKSNFKRKDHSKEGTTKSSSSSPLNSLAERLIYDDPNLQYVEKALKEVLNMQLKQKESVSAPNIYCCRGESGRRPKLSEGKRVKFKSEENISTRDRNKAVQTSFSSENLSTEDGNIDFSVSRVSPSFVESEETLSWSETISSEAPKSRDKKNSTDTIFSFSSSSQTKDCSTLSKNYSCSSFPKRSSNQETESSSYLTSLSPIRSEEASSSQAAMTLEESGGYMESISRSSSKEMNMSQSWSSETNHDLVYTPKMCNIRRFPVSDGSYQGSLDSACSLSPLASLDTAGNSDTGGSDDARSTKLNLPFDSPKVESGLMNCYALSPLHY